MPMFVLEFFRRHARFCEPIPNIFHCISQLVSYKRLREGERVNAVPTLTNEKVGDLPSGGQTEDLNLITPLSSMNV